MSLTQLNTLFAGLEAQLTNNWLAFCQEVADDARSRAPAGKGVLRNSIQCRRVPDSSDRVTCLVGTAVPYAKYVHEGTGIYHPRGRRTRWVYPLEDGGRVLFRSTRGQPAVPFLREAMEQARGRLGNGVLARLGQPTNGRLIGKGGKGNVRDKPA